MFIIVLLLYHICGLWAWPAVNVYLLYIIYENLSETTKNERSIFQVEEKNRVNNTAGPKTDSKVLQVSCLSDVFDDIYMQLSLITGSNILEVQHSKTDRLHSKFI